MKKVGRAQVDEQLTLRPCADFMVADVHVSHLSN
jgi:hypothetical protein